MFQGSFVALITPFRAGRLDEAALRTLIEFQIANGTHGLIPCGTTGESPSLTTAEWERVSEIVLAQAAGRVPVLLGTGTNNTEVTIERTRRARELGADGALVVTPYYNRPTQEGLYQHFAAIADAVDLPLMLYNVPGRTGSNLLPETAARLASIPTIVALKEASGSVEQASQMVAAVGEHLTVLSGDDALTLPMMSVGARGVVSVVANVAPRPVATLVEAMLAGELARARGLHHQLADLTRALFIETNPIPVKTVASWLGFCTAELRLPLVPLSPTSERRLRQVWERYDPNRFAQGEPTEDAVLLGGLLGTRTEPPTEVPA
ncbi:MAG TPA: 4-hydroxy-tetrahydrodipicolinate synthase [Nitrolancea sp.]|nr:4-hydroxy-tetrahydrodipicolinate synthase [Nitrolancea sp.]